MKKIIVVFILITLIVGLSTSAYADNEIELPILMYHSVLKSRNGTYIVTPAQLEQDFKRITEEGYTAVTCEQVIKYIDGEGTLPAKPILITFDDGHYNNMYYAVPLLKKYNLKAVINVIGAFSNFSTTSGDIDNPNYSHLTWDEVTELFNSGVVEIGNHSYNMHKYKPRFGMSKKSGETDEQYKQALLDDIGRLQKILFECTGKECNVLAYPFGKYNDVTERTLADMGFRIMFTCNEGVSKIRQGDKACLYRLKRINRSGRYDTETVMRKISTTAKKQSG